MNYGRYAKAYLPLLRFEIRNLFEASENTAENTFRTDKALIIS